MCEPTTIAATLAVAKVGTDIIGESSRVNEQNAASSRNAAAARSAAADSYQSTTARYVEDQRGLIQAGMDSILEGRANEALSYTSAVENGVQGTSVAEVIMEKRALEGRNKQRNSQEQSSLRTNVGIDFQNINSDREARENSVSRTKFSMAKIVGSAITAGSTLNDLR